MFIAAMKALARELRDKALAEHMARVEKAAGLVKAAVQVAVDLAWGREKPGLWVFLAGEYGSGKTFLAQVAVVEAVRQGVPATFVRMAEILNTAQGAFSREAPQNYVQHVIDVYTARPVLVAVDEAEKVGDTDWRKEIQTMLWGNWYERALAGRLVLIATSNLPRESLPGYIRSRAEDGRFGYVNLGTLNLRTYFGHPVLADILTEMEVK